MQDDKKQEEQNSELENAKKENESEDKKEGSGIFTVDGKELPKVDGGYTSYNPGGTLGDNSFTS